MFKMSITLIVEVIVLLHLLHTGSSTPECAEDCCKEGQTVIFECQVPAVLGTLVWKGVGFDCSSTTTNSNRIISLPAASCPLTQFGPVVSGRCGPYFANMTCTEDQQNLTSVLEFKANYEMNGGNISCQFLRDNKTEIFPVRVGVAPNQPSKLNVRVETQKDRIVHFKWTPPNESIGEIKGYKIDYHGDNCGRCTPEAGFVNQTKKLTAECMARIEENTACNSAMCSFEVSTVSQDCGFDSPPVEATIVLMPCILEISNSTWVNINSTIGEIPRGIEMIPHNTQLNFSCGFNCTLAQNQTRCANGTFQPSISPILLDGCHCSDDSQYNEYVLGLVGAIFFVVLVLVVVVVVVVIIIILYRRKIENEIDGIEVVSMKKQSCTDIQDISGLFTSSKSDVRSYTITGGSE